MDKWRESKWNSQKLEGGKGKNVRTVNEWSHQPIIHRELLMDWEEMQFKSKDSIYLGYLISSR